MASTPNEEFSYDLRVPRDRVAVLVGKKGEVKREIERQTKTKLSINSSEGEVHISGQDTILLYSAREVIRAIGRGFNPDVAMLLLKQDYGFELMQMADFARNVNDIERLRGRVIGEGGKSRRTIEELTDVSICVYGKTVGFIGPVEFLPDARRAVEDLLLGSTHAPVYHWLEKRRAARRVRI